MEHIVETAGCSIYCGPDLSQAVDLSRIPAQSPIRKSHRRGVTASRFLTDIRNARWQELVPRACLVTGRERDSGESLAIGFSGSLRVVDFCAAAMLGHHDYGSEIVARRNLRAADILVSDHPLTNLAIRQPSFRRSRC